MGIDGALDSTPSTSAFAVALAGQRRWRRVLLECPQRYVAASSSLPILGDLRLEVLVIRCMVDHVDADAMQQLAEFGGKQVMPDFRMGRDIESKIAMNVNPVQLVMTGSMRKKAADTQMRWYMVIWCGWPFFRLTSGIYLLVPTHVAGRMHGVITIGQMQS